MREQPHDADEFRTSFKQAPGLTGIRRCQPRFRSASDCTYSAKTKAHPRFGRFHTTICHCPNLCSSISAYYQKRYKQLNKRAVRRALPGKSSSIICTLNCHSPGSAKMLVEPFTLPEPKALTAFRNLPDTGTSYPLSGRQQWS